MTDQVLGDQSAARVSDRSANGMTLAEALRALKDRLKLLFVLPLLAGILALGATYLLSPTFTARASFLPPQQAQSSAASALASLGALGGLAGNLPGASSPAERYVALMQSVTISDRIVDQFKLIDVYKSEFRSDARRALLEKVRIGLNKKDGLITVEVDDHSPQRAAEMANRYVDELRRMTATLAMTEAQQRRAFFERHLQETRDRLAKAQVALESSGFNPGALKAEPRAAAEAYARLRAEATAAELRLGFLRSSLADGSPEVRQQQSALSGLREQLSRAERATSGPDVSDYIGRYREFKYQEVLFDVYARQFELARADESREGSLVQVIDAASPPERKSRPKRALIVIAATVTVGLVLILFIVVGSSLKRT